VSVLLGNGDGTFGAKTDFGTGSSPAAIAIGDLNAGGSPDLAVANLSSSSVSVLLGGGDGTFGAKTDFATGGSAQSVAIADLNADGKPDLATANHSTDTASVLLGNGDGTFGAKADFGTGPGPYSVAIGELNGDGKPDLAVANASSNTVSVLLGTGDGTFGAKTDFETGASPQSVAIGDLNADGKLDLAVANRNPGTVSVLLNLTPGAPAVAPARAFLIGGRTVPVGAGPPSLCVRIEPIDGSFDLSDVDLSTVSMVSEGTGSVGRITATASKQSHSADMDRNGVPEISACFARADLAQLFSSIRGRHEADVAIEGRLRTGGDFRATFQFTMIRTPAAGHGIALSVSPNPMNPRGILNFTMRAPGYVTARLFGLSGRLVRTIIQSRPFEVGEHALVIDGHDDRGAALMSGVYFYRIETPDGAGNGRLVVAK